MQTLVLLLALLSSCARAKSVTGTIRTVSSWLFLDRFVFHGVNDEPSTANFKFKFSARSKLTLLVYFNDVSDASYAKGGSGMGGMFGATGMSSPDVSVWKDIYSR